MLILGTLLVKFTTTCGATKQPKQQLKILAQLVAMALLEKETKLKEKKIKPNVKARLDGRLLFL